MNAIMKSINSIKSSKILNGEQTELIMKNLGKLNPPFKVYAYVSKGGFPLVAGYSGVVENEKPEYMDMRHLPPSCGYPLNGKVCFEFVCDRVKAIEICQIAVDDEAVVAYDVSYKPMRNYTDINHFEYVYDDLLQKACLTKDQFNEYTKNHTDGGKRCYSLHISQLKIYDRPKELEEFRMPLKGSDYIRVGQCTMEVHHKPLAKYPQNFVYVEELK